MLQRGKQLYEGKAKKVFEVLGDPSKVIQSYKDDATAFNAQKRGTIVGKGIVNAKMSAMLFQLLTQKGVQNHFIELLNDTDLLTYRVEIVPLEVVIRNTMAGSLAKRLGIAEGTPLKTPIYDLHYKVDALEDPLVTEYQAEALGWATRPELDRIRSMALKVNQILLGFFDSIGIKLVDFKLEFGRMPNGEIILADEISPDTCRFWDKKTNEKLDKDRFRRDLGNVEGAYQEMLSRVSGVLSSAKI